MCIRDSINSSKSDNLPSYQEYIDKFCSVQYEAFSYLCDKKKDKDLECYIDAVSYTHLDVYKRQS